MEKLPAISKSNTEEITIRLRAPYSLRWTALSHGWVKLKPYQWNEGLNTLERIECIRGKVVHCVISQTVPKHIMIQARGVDALAKGDIHSIVCRFNRVLGLDIDLRPLKKLLEAKEECELIDVIDSGGGRLLRGATLFEDVIKTVFTLNASWMFTKKMNSDFCEAYGPSCPCCGRKAFPDITDVIRPVSIKAGYRNKVIEAILENYQETAHSAISDCGSLYAHLRSIYGIGPYAAAHIMALFGDYSRMPVDREVASYLGLEYSKKNIIRIQEQFHDEWGDWAFLVYKMKRIQQKNNWIG